MIKDFFPKSYEPVFESYDSHVAVDDDKDTCRNTIQGKENKDKDDAKAE
jgi:hypothetical protein